MYEQTFGTDWEAIEDREEVIRRAYALGVATRLGESHPDELDRLVEQVGTTYDRSFVTLAYQEGREEAGDADRSSAGDEAVWEKLVEGKTVVEAVDGPEQPDSDVAETLPEALGAVDIDTLPDDSTERVRRPSFLEGRRADRPAGDGDRTPFGRPVGDVRPTREEGRKRPDEPAETSGGGDENGGADEPSAAERGDEALEDGSGEE